MKSTIELIVELVGRNEVLISDHGYDEMTEDNIYVSDIVNSLASAEVVEDYPGFAKGPCTLVLQIDGQGLPIHSVWGIPKGKSTPAVLVTAYRPDPLKWTNDFKRRIK